jgi:hypothetical protein
VESQGPLKCLGRLSDDLGHFGMMPLSSYAITGHSTISFIPMRLGEIGAIVIEHRRVVASLSLWFHARQRGPFRDFGRDVGGQVGRATGNYLGALLAQLGTDLRQRERRDCGVVQPRYDRQGRAGECKQGVRIVCNQSREAGLRSGWNVGHDSAAPQAGNREGA